MWQQILMTMMKQMMKQMGKGGPGGEGGGGGGTGPAPAKEEKAAGIAELAQASTSGGGGGMNTTGAAQSQQQASSIANLFSGVGGDGGNVASDSDSMNTTVAAQKQRGESSGLGGVAKAAGGALDWLGLAHFPDEEGRYPPYTRRGRAQDRRKFKEERGGRMERREGRLIEDRERKSRADIRRMQQQAEKMKRDYEETLYQRSISSANAANKMVDGEFKESLLQEGARSFAEYRDIVDPGPSTKILGAWGSQIGARSKHGRETFLLDGKKPDNRTAFKGDLDLSSAEAMRENEFGSVGAADPADTKPLEDYFQGETEEFPEENRPKNFDEMDMDLEYQELFVTLEDSVPQDIDLREMYQEDPVSFMKVMKALRAGKTPDGKPFTMQDAIAEIMAQQ